MNLKIKSGRLRSCGKKIKKKKPPTTQSLGSRAQKTERSVFRSGEGGRAPAAIAKSPSQRPAFIPATWASIVHARPPVLCPHWFPIELVSLLSTADSTRILRFSIFVGGRSSPTPRKNCWFLIFLYCHFFNVTTST